MSDTAPKPEMRTYRITGLSGDRLAAVSGVLEVVTREMRPEESLEDGCMKFLKYAFANENETESEGITLWEITRSLVQMMAHVEEVPQ